jgi:hypothetical protein
MGLLVAALFIPLKHPRNLDLVLFIPLKHPRNLDLVLFIPLKHPRNLDLALLDILLALMWPTVPAVCSLTALMDVAPVLDPNLPRKPRAPSVFNDSLILLKMCVVCSSINDENDNASWV